MNIEVISLIGILLGLAVIVYGAMKGYSLILIGTGAALVCALFSGNNLPEMYKTYMVGVGNSVTSLFPIILGGTLIAALMENSDLSESIAIAVINKLGTKFLVPALFIISWILCFANISVYIIIFTVYPLACGFFKVANLPRALIPAIVLGAVVSMQNLPGTAETANIVPTEAFGISPSSGFIIGMTTATFLFVANMLYLVWAAKRYQKKGIGFDSYGEESYEVDLNKTGLPSPWLVIPPLATVLIVLNVFKGGAPLSLFSGAAVCATIFYKRFGGIKSILKLLAEEAKGASSVIRIASLAGYGTLVAAVPGYNLLTNFLDSVSGGNPYVFAFLAVAIIAGCCGSASGGIRFISATFSDKLLAMGGVPAGICRVMSSTAYTFDSLPHNGAVLLTLETCHVTHKEGYPHLFVTTVLNTLISAIIAIIMANLGIF